VILIQYVHFLGKLSTTTIQPHLA